MADIGKVAGPLLESDLDRQGKDLQFSTNSNPLLYLDFANFKAAINANASAAAETFTVNGNVALANLKINGDTITSTTNKIQLGDVSVVKVGGGQNNYVMATDGNGNLSWQNIGSISHDLNLSANNIVLGSAIDGSLTVNSAYRYWNGTTTTVTDAIDNLNQVMLNVYQNTYVGAVDVNANVVVGSSPLTVQFTSTVLGNPNVYQWEFRDTANVVVASSGLINPTYTFSNNLGGVYSIYFKASNSAGTLAGSGNFGDPVLAQGSYADVFLKDYITMYPPIPLASFTVSSTSIDANNSVALTNTSINAESYVIHWGDGSSTVIPSNFVSGAPGHAPISHTYSAVGDVKYLLTLDAYSSDAVPGGITVTSVPTYVSVYSLQLPVISATPVIGNNQHSTIPNGLLVTFTNETSTLPGLTSVFPSNKFRYVWGDGTHTDVIVDGTTPGNVGDAITHSYTLINPVQEQTFSATLMVFSGHSFSPFNSSPPVNITVKPAPTSIFDGTATIISDRTGDTPQIGYQFVDLDGVNRATFSYSNASINANVFKWEFGDGVTTANLAPGDIGTPTGGPIAHTYSNAGIYSPSLLANGPSSVSPTDDTHVRPNYINVFLPPPPPAGLSEKTITIATTGNSPLLVNNATNNTLVGMPAPGSVVTRVTTQPLLETSLVTNAYNATSGLVSAVINGISESPVSMTGNNDVGVSGSLVITEDKDAHMVSPATYPSRFYAVFSGKISRPNAIVPVGFNSYQLYHSTTGGTNVLEFLKDDLVSVPVISVVTASANTASIGAPKYISGVPYFNSGGEITVSGVTVHSWIGQTYLDSASPLHVSASNAVEGSGQIITTQGKDYSQLSGAINYLTNGVPDANTGKTSLTPYTFGNLSVPINGIAAVTGKVSVQISNVNGASASVELPTLINLYSVATVGFDELSIPVSSSLGGVYTDNGVRVVMPSGPNPPINSSVNYYTNNLFAGAVQVEGTDEAIVRFGTLSHNMTDYSQYLPQGPNLSGRTATQFFKFAFRRSLVANFRVTYTGKISGLWIAAPGTLLDQSSSQNGWVDGTQVYAGAGVPGDVVTYGNGSLGCAKTAGDVIPISMPVSNATYTMTLGSENSSNATGNQILVCVALNAGDSLTSISIS